MIIKLKKDLPILSVIMVIINIIVFLICTFTGNLLYNMGRLDIQNVLVGREYGRIVWAMFLHSDFNHLFNNMVILFFLGAMIEKEIGHLTYGIIYLLSGIGGNMMSCGWNGNCRSQRSNFWFGRCALGVDSVFRKTDAGHNANQSAADDRSFVIQWVCRWECG